MHHHQPAARSSQLRVDRRVGETVDVVQVIDAAFDRETLRLRAIAVDRHRRAVRPQRGDDRRQPTDLLLGADRLGRDIARRRAEFDDVGADSETARLRGRRGRIEKPPAVGKRILGDVDDADNQRASHRLTPAGLVRATRRPLPSRETRRAFRR